MQGPAKKAKIENPIRTTIIFFALLGFFFTTSLVIAAICLIIASITFSSIMLEAANQLAKEKKSVGSPKINPTLEHDNALVRSQIEQFYNQVGQSTKYTTQFNASQHKAELPELPHNSRMPSSPKLGTP